MNLGDEAVWSVTRGADLLWRRFQDDFIVYNTGSGNTHLLDLLSGEILQIIETRQPTTTYLRTHIDDARRSQHEGANDAYLDELLERFQRLGLVEPGQR